MRCLESRSRSRNLDLSLAMGTESRTVTQIGSETVVKPGSLKLRFKWVKVIKSQCTCINMVVIEICDRLITASIAANKYFMKTGHDF